MSKISDQCLELCKASGADAEGVRGEIIVSLLSLEPGGGTSGRSPLAVVGPTGDVRSPRDRSPPPVPTPHLPNGWEQRTTNNGR